MGMYIGPPTIATKSTLLAFSLLEVLLSLGRSILAHGQDTCKSQPLWLAELMKHPRRWQTGAFGSHQPQT